MGKAEKSLNTSRLHSLRQRPKTACTALSARSSSRKLVANHETKPKVHHILVGWWCSAPVLQPLRIIPLPSVLFDTGAPVSPCRPTLFPIPPHFLLSPYTTYLLSRAAPWQTLNLKNPIRVEPYLAFLPPRCFALPRLHNRADGFSSGSVVATAAGQLIYTPPSVSTKPPSTPRPVAPPLSLSGTTRLDKLPLSPRCLIQTTEFVTSKASLISSVSPCLASQISHGLDR